MEKRSKLKVIISVAVAIVILAIVGVVFFTGKGSENKSVKEKVYEIGDTIQNEKFEMTLKSIEFVDFINVDRGEKNSNVYYGSDNFGLALEPCKQKLTPKDNETILSYTFEYKYIGKSDFQSYFGFAKPIITFDNDYKFTTNYFSARNNGNGWTILEIDDNKMRMNDILYSGNSYKALEDITYYVRGAIIVPSQVKNNINKSLTIQFNGDIGNETYKIR